MVRIGELSLIPLSLSCGLIISHPRFNDQRRSIIETALLPDRSAVP